MAMHRPTYHESILICGYPNYNGEGVYHPVQNPDFQIENGEFGVRFFGDCHAFTDEDGLAAFERTPQNWFTDSYLEKQREFGNRIVWCAQSPLRHQLPYVTGNKHKSHPILDEADELDLKSWEEYAEFVLQLVLRYAHDTGDKMDLVRISKKAVYGDIQEDKVGLGLIDAVEILNEPNGGFGGSRKLSARGAATCFAAVYLKVRPHSEITLIAPGPIGADLDWQEEFWNHFDALMFRSDSPDKLDNFNVHGNFHWYFRDRSTDQGEGTRGQSPEEANIKEFGDKMDAMCQSYNLAGWECTETGWAARDPELTSDDEKQKAPAQEGYTQLESQGLMQVRTALIWNTCEYFRGVAFYHCQDRLEESAPYTYCGQNDEHWNEKPARTILRQFDEAYGQHRYITYEEYNGVHMLNSEDSTVTLGWTAGEKITIYDGMPREYNRALLFKTDRATSVEWLDIDHLEVYGVRESEPIPYFQNQNPEA